ncbi:resolvase-like protein [Rhizobium azibense]|nr:resolvase-like protein [Rhizobium azibense]
MAYLRTSSAANVGADKDSDRRQSEAISSYAKRAGVEIVDEFYDAAVSGTDPIETRPGFSALLDRIESNGVRTVIVEDASRFARDLVTQELGILALIGRGVTVLTSSGDDLTNTEDPFKVAMRQIAGAFAQLEKARLVGKLKAARDRKRATGCKVEGRKSHAERTPDVVALARKLYRKDRTGNRRSLRDVASELAQQGHLSATGTPFSPSIVKAMVIRSNPVSR